MSDMPPPTRSKARRAAPPGPFKGIPLFRVFGIQIRLDWSWLLIFFLMVFLVRGHFSAKPSLRGQPEWVLVVLSAASVVGLFACVLAHELGHSLVAIRHGIKMSDITLFVFGGMARLRGEPRTAADELKIALAGPAVSVVLAATFWTALQVVQSRVNVVVTEGIRYVAWVNTVLLIFNMIPGFPLDGGRVLRAILWKARGNLLSATQTAASIGKAFGMLLVFAGLLVTMLVPGGLLIGLFHIFMGWFLAGAAGQSVQHLQIRYSLEAFRVADAMQHDVVTVSPEMTLDRLISERFYRHHFKTYPVVADDRFAGLITLADVQRVPPTHWPATTVGQVAEPAADTLTIHPDDGLYEAFRRMGEDDLGRLVVTDHDERVIGLLSRRDIMNFLQIYSGLNPRAAAPRPPRQAIPVAEPVEEPPQPGPSEPAPSGPGTPPPQPGDLKDRGQ